MDKRPFYDWIGFNSEDQPTIWGSDTKVSDILSQCNEHTISRIEIDAHESKCDGSDEGGPCDCDFSEHVLTIRHDGEWTELVTDCASQPLNLKDGVK